MAPSIRVTCFEFIIDMEWPNFKDSIVEYSHADEQIPGRWPLDLWIGAFDRKHSMRFTAIHNKDTEQIRVDVMVPYTGMYRNEVYQKAVIAFNNVLEEALYNYYIKDTEWFRKYRAELIKTLSSIRTKRIKRTTLSLCGTTITIKRAVQSNV